MLKWIRIKYVHPVFVNLTFLLSFPKRYDYILCNFYELSNLFNKHNGFQGHLFMFYYDFYWQTDIFKFNAV